MNPRTKLTTVQQIHAFIEEGQYKKAFELSKSLTRDINQVSSAERKIPMLAVQAKAARALAGDLLVQMNDRRGNKHTYKAQAHILFMTAMGIYKEIRDLDSLNWDAAFCIGSLLDQMGEKEEATEHYKELFKEIQSADSFSKQEQYLAKLKNILRFKDISIDELEAKEQPKKAPKKRKKKKTDSRSITDLLAASAPPMTGAIESKLSLKKVKLITPRRIQVEPEEDSTCIKALALVSVAIEIGISFFSYPIRQCTKMCHSTKTRGISR